MHGKFQVEYWLNIWPEKQQRSQNIGRIGSCDKKVLTPQSQVTWSVVIYRSHVIVGTYFPTVWKCIKDQPSCLIRKASK